MPRILARIGISIRTIIGDLIGTRPFERPWMMRYIDRKLVVDAEYTFRSLNWHIPKRNDIKRRLLFMIENMKNHTIDWTVKNETLLFRVAERVNIKAYDVMMRHREFIVSKMLEFVQQKEWASAFRNYMSMERMVLKWYITMVYQLMATSIRINDRTIVRKYIQAIAYRRYKSGFRAEEIITFLNQLEKIMLSELLIDPEAQKTKEQLFNAINICIQMMCDEIEESFELFDLQTPELQSLADKVPTFQNVGNLKQIISDLENTFFDSMEHDMAREFSYIYDEIKNR
jgi:hypothetical protein